MRNPVTTLLTSISVAAILAASTGSVAAAGIEVHAPAGFAAKPIAKDGSYATEYEVASQADPDAGCQIGFQPARVSRGMDQAQINAAAAEPDYADRVKAGLAAAYDVQAIEPFSMQGVRGIAAIADPKGANGAVRSLLVILETPAGRTNVSCAGNTPRFAALRPGFEAVVRGVTLPR